MLSDPQALSTSPSPILRTHGLRIQGRPRSRSVPLLALLVMVASAAPAATLCVNPGGTGGCYSSIQAAVDTAAMDDTVQIAAGTYSESVYIDDGARLSLEGAGSTTTLLDGGGLSIPLWVVGPHTKATVSHLTLQNGFYGAVVADRGALTLVECIVTGNSLGGVIDDISPFPYFPTGYPPAYAKLSIFDSIISGNGGTSSDAGGGIQLNRSRATIVRSTISGNSAGIGGGIRVHNRGLAVLRTSTISGNSAILGAGMDVYFARLYLFQSTVAGNSAGSDGGGVRIGDGGRFRMQASILADNVHRTDTSAVDNDCFRVEPVHPPEGRVTSWGFNVVENGCPETTGSVVRDVLGIDPLLGPLQDNGGPTLTHAPLAGSPAIDIVPRQRLCQTPDQRGVARSMPCDSGAHEAP